MARADAPAEPVATEPAEAVADADVPPDPTQAELDYAAIYGGQVYDPVAADPTLPAPAELPASYDPWEPLNRRVHGFNNAVDHYVATPLAPATVEDRKSGAWGKSGRGRVDIGGCR